MPTPLWANHCVWRQEIVKKSAFVRRLLSAAAVTGLVATGSLTAAHQTARAAGPVTIIFWNGPDTTGTVPTLIKNFNTID